MTKNEYLAQLRIELKRNGVVDAEDIASEYEQHFAFKLADGFTEEEICAKLDAPASIAQQYAGEAKKAGSNSKGGVFLRIALSFAALFEAAVYILFSGWIVAVAAASLASAALGVCLLGRLDAAGLLPHMPYLSAFIFGVSLLAFAVLLAIGAYYCCAYLRQMIRGSIRWHRNMTAETALPSLPLAPQFNNTRRRLLRRAILWSVTVFGATAVLGIIVSQLLSGALGFWHAWNWFVG